MPLSFPSLPKSLPPIHLYFPPLHVTKSTTTHQLLIFMSLFRSAPMEFYTLKIPREHVYEVLSVLGTYSVAQIIDLKPTDFHKPFLNTIKRCEEALNKLEGIAKKARERNLEVRPVDSALEYLTKLNNVIDIRGKSKVSYIDQIEAETDALEEQINDLYKNRQNLDERMYYMEDMKEVFEKARDLFYAQEDPLINMNQFSLVTVAGTIKTKDVQRFNRMVFRSTRTNSLVYTFNINSRPETSIFFILIPSGDNSLNKVNKIGDGFGVKKYPLPKSKEEFSLKIIEVDGLLVETRQLLDLTDRKYIDALKDAISVSGTDNNFYNCSKIEQYRLFMEKEKMIYVNMNKLEDMRHIAVAHLWVVKESIADLTKLLPTYVSISEGHTDQKPPTHFPLNSFTGMFQEIVNTYGTPRYGEVNAGLFAIPIFPFLFGVMFGDIGHGGILLAMAIWLCRSEKAQKVLAPLYPLRYLFLLMGIFAFYAGWIYNDFFSLPLNLFGSCYRNIHGQQYAQKIPNCVYPIGLDPKWYAASNQLNYFNSFKMKFAVIIGVFQMSVAIFLKLINTIHFKQYLDMIFEWLPQQIFLLSTFGYMCLLIVVKWNIEWGSPEHPASSAPSIIGQMIAMPLKLGSTEGKPLWDQESQESLQLLLLQISVIMVPIMLIPKPVIIWLKAACLVKPAPNKIQTYNINEDDMDAQFRETLVADDFGKQVHDPSHHQQHDMGEIFVHQIIETIEFVLGSISNTASYLRLWALSLAHSQLSKVFLEKTIGGGITSGNVVTILIGYWLFFYITFGVILCMDSMECFLHALRLQWVEFQSKFFKADGWRFEPLSFATTLEAKRVVEQ